MTVAQLLRSSLRLMQISNPTAEELNDALEALNLMLSDWSTSPLGIHKLTRANFNTVASMGAYSIGAGADFDTVRPNKIGISFLRDNTIDTRIKPVSAEDYTAKVDKSTGGRPCELYHEKGYPTGVVFLWPVPDKVYSLFLYMQSPLASYSALSDDVNLPPEYHSAIKYNLVIALSPEFGATVSEAVAVMAQETIRNLKRLHATAVPKVRTNPFSSSGTGPGHGGISDGDQLIYDTFDFPIG